MEKLVSFAQDKEDIVLYHVLKDENNIFYIDAGANDSIYMSVTKIFYDRGGHGINIEPQKKYFESYKKERTRDINLCEGVSDENGTITLYGSGTGASMVATEAEVTEVPVRKLSEICEEYIDIHRPIHFLKIDVEGFERQALQGMNFKKWRPWIVIMESTLPGTDIPCYDKWEEILLQNDYIMGKQMGINRYYIACEKYEYLQPKFNELDRLDELYSVIPLCRYLDMAEEYESLRGKYLSVVNSLCWKMTAPIRKIGSKLMANR